MRSKPYNCRHLTVDTVRGIHTEHLARFGGAEEVRNPALLESAVAAPQATVAGQSRHEDIVEVAAAYLFYHRRNQPFMDGNKRVALDACLIFMRLNSLEPKAAGPEWESLVFENAAGGLDRAAARQRLRALPM